MRLLVQTLLTEEFGLAMLNDAAFQAVVDEVASNIEASPDIGRDIDQVIDKWFGTEPG